jgi:hypothetical protein
LQNCPPPLGGKVYLLLPRYTPVVISSKGMYGAEVSRIAGNTRGESLGIPHTLLL